MFDTLYLGRLSRKEVVRRGFGGNDGGRKRFRLEPARFVSSNELEDCSVRQIRWLVEHEPPVFDDRFQRLTR